MDVVKALLERGADTKTKDNVRKKRVNVCACVQVCVVLDLSVSKH